MSTNLFGQLKEFNNVVFQAIVKKDCQIPDSLFMNGNVYYEMMEKAGYSFDKSKAMISSVNTKNSVHDSATLISSKINSLVTRIGEIHYLGCNCSQGQQNRCRVLYSQGKDTGVFYAEFISYQEKHYLTKLTRNDQWKVPWDYVDKGAFATSIEKGDTFLLTLPDSVLIDEGKHIIESDYLEPNTEIISIYYLMSYLDTNENFYYHFYVSTPEKYGKKKNHLLIINMTEKTWEKVGDK